MNTRTIIEYILAAIIVIVLGALAGWYFFLRDQTRATTAADAARGYNASLVSSERDASLGSSGTGGVVNRAQGGGSSVAGGTAPSSGSQSGGNFFSRVYDAIFGNPGVSDFSKNQSVGVNAFLQNAIQPAGTTTAQAAPQLWHASKDPVAGFGFIGSTTKLQYAERATGYLIQLDPSTQSTVRLTNTLMPKVYEALFSANGSVIERSLAQDGEILSYAGSISTSTPSNATSTAGSLVGVYLPNNILQVAINPATRDVFYLSEAPGGVAGTMQHWDGTKSKRIFTSPITHWHLRMFSDGSIVLFEAPADGIPGYAYSLSSTGELTALVRAVPGLTLLPRERSGALIFGSSNGALSLFVQGKASSTSAQLSVQTIADKCVWAPGKGLIAYCAVPQIAPTGAFLNAWYKGQIHTADAWWKVDVSAGTAQLIYTPEHSLDVVNPQIDSSGQYIAFMNNTDLSLWVLRINK